MMLFQTAMMTLTDEFGNVIKKDLDCQLDTVNIPWNAESVGPVPTDWYDLYSMGWITPIPARSNYFIDQATGTKYSVFGNVATYFDHLEVRISKYSGGTP